MSESHRPAPGAGTEPKCSKQRGVVATPEFVEVSPLMRSCIFGFNTHVAELPSSATDVRGGGISLLAPCKTLPGAELAVRKAFLSQLPTDVLRKAWCNDTAVDKGRRTQRSQTEPPSGMLLEDAPSWAGRGSHAPEANGLLPAELRSRLAALMQQVDRQGENKDSRLSAKSAGCRRGRQLVRRSPAGLRMGHGMTPGDKKGTDSVDASAPSLLAVATDGIPTLLGALSESGTRGNTHDTAEKEDATDLGKTGLLGALSLSIDKLAEPAGGEAQGVCDNSPLLGSPASTPRRGNCGDEHSLRLADVTLPLESSSFTKEACGAGGPFFSAVTFSLPHGSIGSSDLLDDVVEPMRRCAACEESQATAVLGDRGAVRLPLDAGSVFGEVQMTMLALLEDLHAATCCCAAASSPESCACCFSSSILTPGKGNSTTVLPALRRNAGFIMGRAGAARDGVGEPTLLALSSGTRSPSPIRARPLHLNGSCANLTAQSVAAEAVKVKNGDHPSSCSPSLQDSGTPKGSMDETASRSFSLTIATGSCSSPAALHTDGEALHDGVRLTPNGEGSTGDRRFSGSGSRGDERTERDSLSETASGTDAGAEAGAPLAPSGGKNLLRLPAKGGDSLQNCGNDDAGYSLHLLFRHHTAVVACADRFAELLPYSHIFRECVGTYRMPTTLPSPARHLLVQELLLLRHDPDRFLARNSFNWTDAAGALLCPADQPTYSSKWGGTAEAQQPDRLSRGDETGGVLTAQTPSALRTDILASVREEQNAGATMDAAAGTDSSSVGKSTAWGLPLPLLDPTVLLSASGTELAAQKSAVLRILRMLRSLAPSWAARDDNFGFHFRAAITATSLDSPELQSYRVVFQCLSPFDAREWTRDQLMEVLSDLDCIRLANRRRRNLRASVARVQRFVEQPEGEAVGSGWHGVEGAFVPRHRWELNNSIGGYADEGGASHCPPRQVIRGSREILSGQHAASISTTTGSSCASRSTPIPNVVQSLTSSKEAPNSLQPAPMQLLSPNSNGAKSASRAFTTAGTRHGATEGVPYAESDADLQAVAMGAGASGLPATSIPPVSARRGQSPVGSSIGGRRNGSSLDAGGANGGKAGSTSPSDCPMRQQYAVRAAELPKIKGVFIGKKHTCWVAQWNDANGQPRQSCFNIKQHGFEKARRLAVQARQALMGMSTSKPANNSPAEAQRATTQPVRQAASATREPALVPTRLPDLLLMRDTTTAIAEAFGSRTVQTPTALLPSVNAKLEGLAGMTDGHAIAEGHHAGAPGFRGASPSSLNASHSKLAMSGNVSPRSPRGEEQRPTIASLPAELCAASVAAPAPTQKQELGTVPTSVPDLKSSGAKQQLLLQHRLQQQLKEQLQQLQQLQQQLMQPPSVAPQRPGSSLSALLPDVISRIPSTSGSMGVVDGSSSALALVNTLLGNPATSLPHVPPFVNREHANTGEPSGAFNAPHSAELQQQQAASSAIVGPANELQGCMQGFKAPCGDALSSSPEEAAGTSRTPCVSAEVLEEDGIPACPKRKHRLLYVNKQGKRTLASLAREFPSVGGVTYNVKCACWEVTVKGRETAKVFSTRKFGGLEAAYGAAVMWKRKVERGEEGADDADGPEGQEDDGDDVDESEGPGGGPSAVPWEAGLEGDEPALKRAAFGPDAFRNSLGVSLQQQHLLPPVSLPSVHVASASDQETSQAEQLLSRTTNL